MNTYGIFFFIDYSYFLFLIYIFALFVHKIN